MYYSLFRWFRLIHYHKALRFQALVLSLTGHGFRHTMSTILHENGIESAWIEMQLAHVDKDSIGGAYNHAQYIKSTRVMLDWHAILIESMNISHPLS